MGNDTFTLTKSYGDGIFWTEAIMDAIKAEVEAQFNTVIKNNFDQLKADLFESGYTFDDDGAGNLTNALFDKQKAEDTYTSDISVGTSTDVAFVDVDATNASITFTPELAGEYLVQFQFCEFIEATTGNAPTCTTLWQLTDGTNDSNPMQTSAILPAIGGAETTSVIPVTLSHIFNFTASAKTVKLQKRVTAATNLNAHNLLGTLDQVELYMRAIKI